MNLLLVLIAALSPLGGQAFAQAAAGSTSTISLPGILSLIEKDNPEILAARRRWEAFQKKVGQAYTPEKPRLDIERMYAPAGSNVLTQADERSLSISQEIPFPTSLYLRGSLAAREAAMAEQDYRAKVREVLARARSAFAMLYLAHKSLDIFNENVDLMRRFSKVAESKYAAGHASQSDALKAQVELTRMLNMSVILSQDREIAEAMLNALLNRQAEEPLGIPARLDLDGLDAKLEDLQAAASSRRPELRRAFLDVERAGKSLALARSEYLPDLMLQYRRRSDPMRGRTHDAVIGLSIPLWFWKPAAAVAQARAEKEASEAELRSMTVMTSADLKSAWVRARTARRLAEIYRTSVIPQGEAALKVAESGYQAEKASFLDLLDAQRSLLEFKLEYHQYAADFAQRYAELERIVGQEL